MTQIESLKEEIERIGSALLTTAPSQHIDQDEVDKSEIRIKAYYLLTHAAIERYIENICLRVVSNEWDDYSNNKKLSSILVNIAIVLQYTDNGSQAIGTTKIQSFRHANLLIKKIKEIYEKLVEENHGISERNIRTILLPLGIDCGTLDNTEMSTLTSFSKSRGSLAHNSGAKVLEDAGAAKAKISQIVTIVERLEIKISNDLFPTQVGDIRGHNT